MAPSITYWHRIEPRPRSNDFKHGLAAEIRDAAWMLARQWQLGEFHGEDAGSPAYIQLITQVADLQAWQAGDTVYGLDSAPLEDVVESEAFTPDLALRAEIGQTFEMLLDQRGAAANIAAFRRTYPLPLVWQNAPAVFTTTADITGALDAGSVPEALLMAFATAGVPLATGAVVWTNIAGREWAITDPASTMSYAVVPRSGGGFAIYRLLDRETLPFLRVCAGRAIDGVALLQAGQSLPAGIPMPDEARDALKELSEWYTDLVRNPADASAWQPDRLEYQVSVFARDARSAGFIRLRARPERDGAFDWHAFDFDTASAAPSIQDPRAVREDIAYSQPNRLTFRGMPNVRWWEFENNLIDIGAVQPEKRDLSRLILMDFMLVAGNDWFVIPYRQAVGTACWVDLLAVHDVFGRITRIKAAAPAATTPRAERWSMFTHSNTDQPNLIAPFFILPPTAGSALEVGPVLEEVRFLRDEMANLVWAIEEWTENAVGIPWPRREYDNAARPPMPNRVSAQSLRYIVQSPVPSYWIPFSAVRQNDGVEGRVKLEMLGLLDGQAHFPHSRVLQPSPAAGTYLLWEEEVPHEGVRVLRGASRSRWLNGQTYVWIARRRSPIAEQGTIGLRFDQAVPRVE